jgi:pimeloyl-ACP methyl ester carboxylesterase
MPYPYDPSKPTLILVNAFVTSVELYARQYKNKQLTDAMNLLAIELLGHGNTRTVSPSWTYWHTAEMNLQVMEALGIKKAFVLGTSQGGWITARMALLAPEKIEGIIPLGTSMDYESERTVKLGCWDCIRDVTPTIDAFTTTENTPDFEAPTAFCDFLVDIGLGKDVDPAVREHWRKIIKSNYRGNDGRLRARMAAINLRDRDGLHARLFDITCPVLWLHGTNDVVYSIANAQEEIKLFKNSKSAELVIVKDGTHFLSADKPEAVDNALISFVGKWANKHI